MPPTIRKVSITHDAIIDFVIARPEANYREIGAEFGYTAEGIGIICRSDAFKARLAERKADLVDPLLKQSVDQRLTGLAHASLDILMRKLEVSEDPKLALATLEASQRATGYGAKGTSTINTQTNYIVQLPGPASSSQEWSSKFGKPVLEVPAAEVIQNG